MSAPLDEQEVFRLLFSAYPDALLLVDADGIIVKANPSAATLLRYEVDEMTDLSVEALVPDSIRPRHAAYRQAYAHAPRTRPMGNTMELQARRKDGSVVIVEIALSPLVSRGGPLTVAAIRDIGAYPRVKQALKRARYSEHLAKLGRIAVDARDPQVLLDAAPQVAREAFEVEIAAVYLLEPNRQQLLVASVAGTLPDGTVGEQRPNRTDTLPGFVVAGGETVVVPSLSAETRFTVSQGVAAAQAESALAVPVSDRGRVVGVLAVFARDEHRFGDDEARFLESAASLLATTLQRAQTEEALQHSQRLESVGQLTGGIAHDFNNLLTVIQGNLQVLEELPVVAEDAYGQQLVEAALRASRRAAELTGKLLAFSRRQVLQPSEVDVGAMLRSLADMLRRTLDQRIRIELDLEQPSPTVVADAGQLESALLNIAINARDAMPQGGVLRFHAASCGPLAPEVREELGPGAHADASYVAIAISDTGMGMPEDVKERAFEPFFTTKEAGRGTGLGLSTVYGFVKQSRGAIALASDPGAGTTLTLVLPRPVARTVAPGVVPPVADAVRAGLRVLLVEDDAEVRVVVRTFLAALRCEVTPVASGELALQELELAGGFDLLLTDIALGAGLRGTELAVRAQAREPTLRVLLMSGFSEELLDADRDAPQDWELLRKPFSRDELARAIAAVTA
jgi:PAS domain S-box-containing protein